MTKIYLQNNAPDFELQAGNYTMPANPTISEFITALQKPINETDIYVRILEWSNIFDIDQCLSNPEKTIFINSTTQIEEWCIFEIVNGEKIALKNPLINSWEFIAYTENFCNLDLYPSSAQWSPCDLKYDFVFLSDVESLEWYLYPDTYAINPNTFTVKTLAVKMLENFQSKVIDSRIISDMWSIEIFDIITLASIVEKEERDPAERPTVAGILKKRLDEGWMIGADITVCYPFRLTAEQCKLSVTKYLYEVNDYNTRQKVGLPAGPIWNPSRESISAVVNPVDSPYYYYLHDTLTGKIYYWRDNAEHERNKRLYLR